jgi:hypothetical protein
MNLFSSISTQFIRYANVGNLVNVLVIVIILLIKPAEAIMV